MLAAVLSGCGGGPSGDASAPRATATEMPTPVTITAPRRGDVLRARLVAPRRAAARVEVEGRGAPGARVLLSAGCTDVGCTGLARADERGRWSARLRVVVPTRRPVATIEAYDPAAGDDRAGVRVRLRAPALRVEEGEPEAADEAPAAAPRGPRPRTFVLIGDSLARGIEVHLPPLLEGWELQVDTRIGRPLAEGMRILADAPLGPEPKVIAISLFTNDDPRAVDALEAAVRASVARAGTGGCAVWATIVRPPFDGVGYGRANATLESLAFDPELSGRLLIVPWADAVRSNPSWLADDGVHATPEGYRGRAQMYVDAAEQCGS